jgi:hypothetical protein
MFLVRNAIHRAVIDTVLRIAPPECLVIQVSKLSEDTSRQEIFFDEANQALNGPFGEGVSGLAKLRFKAKVAHEQFVVLLPDRTALIIPADDDALHVVREDILRDAHVQEGMDHTDEEILLAGIGEEFDIAFSTAMADHGKAGNPIGFSLFGLHFDESPIHLVGLAGSCPISSAAVSLWGDHLALGRDKVLVGGDVILNNRFSALEPVLLQAVKNSCGIRDTLPKQGVNNAGNT